MHEEENIIVNIRGQVRVINLVDFEFVKDLIYILTNNGLQALESVVASLSGHQRNIGMVCRGGGGGSPPGTNAGD